MTETPHDLATLAALARSVRAEVDELVSLLEDAVETQWLPSPTPKPRDDTAERSLGEHSDPTSTIALDERRLSVRDTVHRAARALENAKQAASYARDRLESSLDSWAGHSD